MRYNVVPKIQFSSCVKVEDDIYLYSVDKKALLKNRVGESECIFLNEIIVEGEYINNIELMKFYNGKIYMLDTTGMYLIIYKLDSNEYKIVKMNFHVKDYQNYAGAELIANELIVFSYTKKEIAVVDLLTDSISKFYSYDGESVTSTIIANNKVYGFRKNGEMICYDSMNGIIERSGPNMNYRMISNLLSDNSAYYLNENGDLMKYNFDSEEIEDMNITISDNNTINCIVATKSNVWFLPTTSQDIICWDGMQTTVFSSFPKDYGYLRVDCHKFWGYAEDTEKIYISQHATNYMIVINKISGQADFIKLSINSNDYMRLLVNRNEPIYENEDVGLKLFLNSI